ncbi:MAG: hypothetical protein A2V79_12465 [Betaproteobacteria bacterium RBG_16_56_24]|nr:MAG: hypothetical protein A2V79_12465 [Betaproteobacteria bacterium RBG_16_56_24]
MRENRTYGLMREGRGEPVLYSTRCASLSQLLLAWNAGRVAPQRGMPIRDSGDELKFFKGGYGMKEFQKSNLKLTPLDTLDRRDAAILDTIRCGARGRADAATLRRALRDKAHLITCFNHFSRLCIGDLREAYIGDRQTKTRTAKNRRLTWLAMYRHFAAHADIKRDLQIIALDRQDNYACNLIDRKPPDEWGKLVSLAQSFGITEGEIEALYQHKQARAA